MSTEAISVVFARDHLQVSARLDAGRQLVLSMAEGTYSSSEASGDGVSMVSVPYEPLYSPSPLAPRLWVSAQGHEVESLGVPPMLQAIDIRNSTEFTQRVQLPNLRMKDPEALRFAARRLLKSDSASFDDRAGAVCTLGYRVLETCDPADSDLEFLKRAARETLALARRSERYARWVTSMTTMLSYLAILERDLDEAERQLNETLSYRPFLPQLSLLHTNFSRSNIVIALLRAARYSIVGANAALDDIEHVYRTGVRSSWLDDRLGGRFQYSEVDAVLKVAKLAAQVKADLSAAVHDDRTAEYVRSVSIAGLSGDLANLERHGHWAALLEQAIKAAPPTHARTQAMLGSRSVDDGDDMARLIQSIAHWQNSQVGTDFTNTVGGLFADLRGALLGTGDTQVIQSADRLLTQLFSIEPPLRTQGLIGWRAIYDLARLRLIAGCAVATYDRQRAHCILEEQTAWCKMVLAKQPLGSLEDYELARLLVAAGLASYLAAHRYLVPQERHVADAGIPDDLSRNLLRVFEDDPLRVRVFAVLQGNS